MAVGTNKTITVGNPDTGEMIDIAPARIIHYVNIHDELVEAVEDLLDLCYPEFSRHQNEKYASKYLELLKRAKVKA